MVYVVEFVCDHLVVHHVSRKYCNGFYVGYCDFRKGMARCAMSNEMCSSVFRERGVVEQRIIRYFELSTRQGTFAFGVEMFGQKEDE